MPGSALLTCLAAVLGCLRTVPTVVAVSARPRVAGLLLAAATVVC
jgi:hypothetical protein